MIGCTQQGRVGMLLLAACLLGPNSFAQDDSGRAVQEKHSSQKKAEFAEFQERVQAYEKLRNSLKAGIPPVHRKDTPEQIQKHENALAEKTEDARKDAKPGDIFTDRAKEAFRYEIQRIFSGKHAQTIRQTMVQGSPVRVNLYVNKPYPDTMAVTTVPPTLLEHFPKLPKEIEYRIVGDNLVLEDLESRLVIDIFAGAFPNAPPH